MEEEYDEENLYFHLQNTDAGVNNQSVKRSMERQFEHIDFGLFQTAENNADELRSVLKKSSLGRLFILD